MAEDDSKLIRLLYAGALQRDPEERDEYLADACAGRPDVRDRVAALLASHASDFVVAPAAAGGVSPSGHASAAVTGALAEGRTIGPYIIRREIGRGGMGVVYLADDTRLPRRVALKALHPGIGQTPSLRERLRNEARIAAGLVHPGIATVYALDEIDGELYMACEFVPGAPLRALLKSGPVPIDQVIDIGVQLANALAEAHTHGVVHRDLKPENVMKTPSGVVKILDFGLARAEHAEQPRLTEAGTIMGTPAYLAPEQALGHGADFRTDLFALGLLVYELTSGRNPFVAQSLTATIARIVEEDPPPLSQVQPQSVPELDRIVEKCLRKDPLERYGSTQELVADLERLRGEVIRLRSTPSTGASPAAAIPRSSTPHQWLAIHQIAVSVTYVAMLYPAWYARNWLDQPWRLLFLLSMLAIVATATSLRLHLWFTARHLPHGLAAQQAWTWQRTRLCDAGFAAAQIAVALAIGANHPEFAMLFVGVSTAILVVSFVIEPATAAALDHSRRGA